MLHHVVLFALEGFATESEKAEHLLLIKQELEALPKLIPDLHTMLVEFNINTNEPYDIMLTATVDDLLALEQYAAHPEHIRVVSQYIKPYIKYRACVDLFR